MTITLEVAAILLSCVSFLATVLGFFASLKFYRDGVTLQNTANSVLSDISAKTNVIENQMGHQFDRMLTATLERRTVVNENIEGIETQVENAKTALTAAIGQIDEAGADHLNRIQHAVDEQLLLIQSRVESTKDSVDYLTLEELSTSELALLRAVQLYGGLSAPERTNMYYKFENLCDRGFLRSQTHMEGVKKYTLGGGAQRLLEDADASVKAEVHS